MLDYLKSKGVNVDDDNGGFTPDREDGLLQWWMVRTRTSKGKPFDFCCAFDMIGDSRLVIGGTDYPLDESVLESLMAAVKRNLGYALPEPSDILLCPDYDCYYQEQSEKDEEAKLREDFVWELRWKIEHYTEKDDLDNRSKKELSEFISCLYDEICEHLNK